MNDIPDKMPERPPPHPTTKVPRVYGLFGTVCYGGSAIVSIISVLSMGVFNWTPPWYIIASALIYVFTSSSLIFFGRIESNKDARFFIQALRKLGEENKRSMRKMN